MKNKVNNNQKASNESLRRSINSVDGAILGLDDAHPHSELQELEDQFKMNLSEYEKDVQEEVTYILIKLLEYPSSHEAQEHQSANRLGLYDLKSLEEGNSQTELTDSSKMLCKDCGLAVQPSSIPLCANFQRFPKMGIAAYLYFQNIKNLIVLVFLLACFYSSYTLYVNINQPSSTISMENFVKKLSFASTVQNLAKNTALYDSMLIEGWLVAAGVILWLLVLFIMKRNALKQERMVDDETITAADFSIMLEHIPVTFTKESLQKQLNLYYQQLKDHTNIHGKENLRPFTIRNFCKAIPFYFLDDETVKEQIKELDTKISQKRESISELVEEVKDNGKFKTGAEDRKALYAEYLKLCSERSKRERQLKDLSKNFNCIENKELTTAAFITFEHSESANAIEAANPRGLAARLSYYLSCCSSGVYFLGNNDITTCRAPQPEDIIWENIGIPDCSIILRKLVTYFVTLILLGASFGIVYGLTILQITYTNSILSIAISLSITLINIVIAVAIRKLTIYESDITSTKRQTGLALKSIFAQLMNSILVPCITNIYIQQNTYEPDGLVYDIFYLSITSAILPPILKLLDIPFRIKQITICFYSDPHQKLALSQKELNSVYELPEFELGVQYIYFINLFYFTCFYVFVQPCIILFALIGFILMYWAEKHSLLGRSRRPKPSSSLLNETMSQLVGFAPCMLSLGQFVWFNLIRQDYHNFSDSTYISHLVALGCSALFFLLPFNVIFNALCSIPDDEDLNYDQVRSQLTSDYDLYNPVTAEQALGEFFTANGKGHQQLMKNNYREGKINPTLLQPDQKSEIKSNAKVVKIARRSNQLTEESILDQNQQISFFPDASMEDQNFMSKYPLNVTRKDRKRASVEPEPKKPILQRGLSGYHAGSLKQRDIENSPYKDLQF